MSEMNIGMKNALILLWPALAVDVVLLLERLEAADAAADDDADAIRIVRRAVVESRIGHRLDRRGDRVLGEQVGSLGLFALHVDERVEALYLAREPNRKGGRVELRDRAAAGNPLGDCAPSRRHVVADWRDRPHPGDDDPAFAHAVVPTFWFR